MDTSKKKIIKIENLQPGMIFTAPLFIDEHNILVRANEPIKKTDIEKLLKWGIDKVYTEGEILLDSDKTQPKTDDKSKKFTRTRST